MDEVKGREETDPNAKITENQAVLNMSAQLKELMTDALNIFDDVRDF